MNEVQMADIISKKRNISFEEAKKHIDAMIECIIEQLEKGEDVLLVNFGRFCVVQRGARKGFNPYYRKSVDIPPCKAPVFKPGKVLLETIRDTDIS